MGWLELSGRSSCASPLAATCSPRASQARAHRNKQTVEAQTLVKAFKQQCVDEGQLYVALFKITVELIRLTAVSNNSPAYERVLTPRLSDGALLDDDTSVAPAKSHVLVSQAPACCSQLHVLVP